jgi:hypothetical protein
MKFTIFLFVFVTLVLAGCKKPVTEPNSGIYRGTFFQIYNEEDTNAQGVVNLALTKDGFGGSFQVSGDTSTGAPYSHYGTYVIDNSVSMTFDNDASVEVGYQPHYLLDTVYQYTFDDFNFTLELIIDTARYEYKMVRI